MKNANNHISHIFFNFVVHGMEIELGLPQHTTHTCSKDIRVHALNLILTWWLFGEHLLHIHTVHTYKSRSPSFDWLYLLGHIYKGRGEQWKCSLFGNREVWRWTDWIYQVNLKCTQLYQQWRERAGEWVMRRWWGELWSEHVPQITCDTHSITRVNYEWNQMKWLLECLNESVGGSNTRDRQHI